MGCTMAAVRARYNLGSMREAAQTRAGECLATEYKTVTTKVPWRCHLGHEWLARFKNILAGYWCPTCGGNVKPSIETVKAFARDKDGECRSNVYVNGKSALLWACKYGHTWNASFDSIKNSGSWCPYCLGLGRISEDQAHALAVQRGGKCDTKGFSGSRSRILWTCANDHTWDSTYANVKAGNWCLKCSGKEKHTIEQMEDLAQSRRGFCLSPNYVNQNTKLRWMCEFKHEWDATPVCVKLGTWCPHCRLKNETECRSIIERLTRQPFTKRRPIFLEGLELDGFNEETGIAFEYQGEQHYKIIAHFYANGHEDLLAQQDRDATKAALCEDNHIDLLIIPYWIEDKHEYIRSGLHKIYERRHARFVAAWNLKSISQPQSILDSDPIWEVLGLA